MLLVHILNILKLIRFRDDFRNILIKAITNKEFLSNLNNYIINYDIASRNFIWDFFSTAENIDPANRIIRYWQSQTPNHKSIEESLENQEELPFHYNMVGRAAESDHTPEIYKAMLENARKEKFFFHRVCIINTDNKLKYLFY